MENQPIPKSELVLTEDESVYHLNLKPGDIAETIFLVGDPGRVALMSSLFDNIELKTENREFVTHTGFYNKKRISVISTGIGTDNIDIVVNELDALVNINLATRCVKEKMRSLNLIRIGTSGALHEDIEPGSVIISDIAGGLDNLLHYYKGFSRVVQPDLSDQFMKYMNWNPRNSEPYFVPASDKLIRITNRKDFFHGITLSAPGFYAPQGRALRMEIADPEYVDKISLFRYGQMRINNLEMEGSALYGLSVILGHHALTICIALANRITGKFITDYQPLMKGLLLEILNMITTGDEQESK